ncbi:MAG: pseudouridine synthase, partial [Firmicutes bacterium]|nr:pseudouridine synthase [Bacillota bacterium]
AQLRYLLLYKPAGYITSVHDERGRRTVIDLFKASAENFKSQRLYPVGRLDYATSGALLLTNDGELTNALLHPKGEITKVYQCCFRGRLTADKLSQLEHGVKLDDGWTAPARVRRINDAVVELAIHEGRNRQVRRMMAAVGLEVIWLNRISFAGLTLQGLKPSQWRELTASEIERLLALKESVSNK